MPRIKTHTAQKAEERKLQVQELCRRLGATQDQWLMLFFETGCQNAELQTGGRYLSWVTEPFWGYWADWMAIYMEDDKHLMDDRIVLRNWAHYAALKQEYVDYLNNNNNNHAQAETENKPQRAAGDDRLDVCQPA